MSFFKDLFRRGGGDPPRTLANFTSEAPKEGICIRCGEAEMVNSNLFCMLCWHKAVDLARWAAEKKKEAGQEGNVTVLVADWAYVLAAKFPRDPGPDPADPTWPRTRTPPGAYWNPSYPQGSEWGICKCHAYVWN